MEDNPKTPMEKNPTTIIRRSIYTFLQNYHYFTSTSALFALPFSISILLSQNLLFPSSSTLLSTLYTHLQILFRAAGFPTSSQFFYILNLKLSQTISSSIFTLPFTLTFFLLAKASVIQALNYIPYKPIINPPSFSSTLSIFSPLLATYIWNTFLIISANATAFCFLFLSLNFLEGFGFGSVTGSLLLSAAGAVFYSVILAHALIISNLSLVLSGSEKSGGYLSILKACVIIRGKTSTALFLALPVNLAMAGIEALFQYRIVRAYHNGLSPNYLMILEGMLIAYLYSVFLVLDTIVSYFFFKSCKLASSCIDQEDGYTYRIIEIAEEEAEEEDDYYNADFLSSKVLQGLP